MAQFNSEALNYPFGGLNIVFCGDFSQLNPVGKLFLHILEIVMRNNIFSFSNIYWIQLSGTAMGTPAACSYATITYGHFENTEILTEFRPQILFYKKVY